MFTSGLVFNFAQQTNNRHKKIWNLFITKKTLKLHNKKKRKRKACSMKKFCWLHFFLSLICGILFFKVFFLFYSPPAPCAASHKNTQKKLGYIPRYYLLNRSSLWRKKKQKLKQKIVLKPVCQFFLFFLVFVWYFVTKAKQSNGAKGATNFFCMFQST